MTALSKVFGGGKKKAPPPPPEPTDVTRVQKLAASKLKSRNISGKYSLIGGTTLGPTEEIVNQDQSNTLG